MRNALKNITRQDLEPLWAARKVPLDRIASALGVSRQGLAYKAESLGLPRRGKNYEPQRNGNDDLFSRMWLAGVSVCEMAKFFGYAHAGSVTVRRRNLGLPGRTRGGPGGWRETISLAEFQEIEMGRRMQETANARRRSQ